MASSRRKLASVLTVLGALLMALAGTLVGGALLTSSAQAQEKSPDRGQDVGVHSVGPPLMVGEPSTPFRPYDFRLNQSPEAPPLRAQGVMSGPCTDCVLVRANLHRYVIRDGDFTGANFSGATLTFIEVRRALFSRANFSDADLTSAALGRGRFDRAVFVRAHLINLNGAETNFTNADFSRALMGGANFRGATLRGAILIGAVGDGVQFVNADLRDSRLNRARLLRADFTNADVRGAEFTNADLSGANLQNVRGLTQRQLAQACGDAQTRLPPALSLRHCASPRA